jgi:hypothetical protein
MYSLPRLIFTELLSSNDKGDTHIDIETDGRFMKYSVEIAWGTIIYILSFLKLNSGIQHFFGGGGVHRERLWWSHKPTFMFENKESWLHSSCSNDNNPHYLNGIRSFYCFLRLESQNTLIINISSKFLLCVCLYVQTVEYYLKNSDYINTVFPPLLCPSGVSSSSYSSIGVALNLHTTETQFA